MSTDYHKILIITAPSGAGKTSITKHLMQRFPQLAFSISAATRTPRSNEKDGVDYYFMDEESFQHKIKEKAFAEWEMVYEGKYYGTLKSELERIWNNGQVPVLDIDVKGAIHVQKQYPINTLSVFIEPPSVEELKKRLMGRGTETAETLTEKQCIEIVDTFVDIGYVFIEERNVFVKPKPYPSYILNDSNIWENPVANPTDENNVYSWNEEERIWELFTPDTSMPNDGKKYHYTNGVCVLKV